MWCETKETQPLSTGTIKGVRKVCLNETLYMIKEQFRWQPPTQKQLLQVIPTNLQLK